MLRVAFISYWSCPRAQLGVLSAGGLNVYLFNLANKLNRRNFTVDIFTRSHRANHSSFTYLSDQVCLVHLPVSSAPHYQASTVFARKIMDFIKENNYAYDLLHAHYYYSGLVGLILKKELDIPLLQTFHTLGEMKKRYAGLLDQKRIDSEKEIVNKADKIIVSTVFEKKDLLDNYRARSQKIEIINPGVDHGIFRHLNKARSRQKLKLSSRLKYLLFVGRIDPVKGLELLLEAVCQLNSQIPQLKKNTRLLIIGGDITSRGFWKNSQVNRIIKYIKDIGLSDCSDFIGNQPHHRLPLYYSAADLVVLPSVYESFGLVILEAMACGAPVLASEVGGIKFLIKDGFNGRLFKNGSLKDLTDKLNQLLHNNKERELLGRQAFITSQKYSWEKQADKMVSLYERLIN